LVKIKIGSPLWPIKEQLTAPLLYRGKEEIHFEGKYNDASGAEDIYYKSLFGCVYYERKVSVNVLEYARVKEPCG